MRCVDVSNLENATPDEDSELEAMQGGAGEGDKETGIAEARANKDGN